MHLFNVKNLFVRRRKYERVLGGGGRLPADQQGLDVVLASPSASLQHCVPSKNYMGDTTQTILNGQQYPLNRSPAQETSSKHAMYKGSSSAGAYTAPSSSSTSSMLWGFKVRPKLRMRKQKSLKLVSSTPADRPQPLQAAVQNFLQGPSQDEEIYNQQCRDLLRKLSARGNRVPGFT